MLTRRDLLFSSAFASRLRADGDAAQTSQVTDAMERELRQLTDAVQALHRATSSADLAQIRDKQRVYFKTNERFPEFIDVGLRVWERLYDWHIDNQLPLKVVRASDGRLEMEVMSTLVLLKWEMGENEIGQPY